LAQAILGFPKIIILDEPTVGLDPKQVVEIRELVRQLAKEHTVILSSHILSEIRAVCDRVLIIRKGRFVACDSPENLEELLSASNEIELLAKTSPEHARELVSGIAGIGSCNVAEQSEDTVRLTVSTQGDLREALFFAFARDNTALLELKPRMASLEDVFLDLTDDDDAVAGKAAALLNRDTHKTLQPKEEDSHESDL
jgi:ABC-2 type transport system ATP-binding protein